MSNSVKCGHCQIDILNQSSIIVCKSCVSFGYCSKKCQKDDKPNHRKFCKAIQKSKTKDRDFEKSFESISKFIIEILFNLKIKNFVKKSNFGLFSENETFNPNDKNPIVKYLVSQEKTDSPTKFFMSHLHDSFTIWNLLYDGKCNVLMFLTYFAIFSGNSLNPNDPNIFNKSHFGKSKVMNFGIFEYEDYSKSYVLITTDPEKYNQDDTKTLSEFIGRKKVGLFIDLEDKKRDLLLFSHDNHLLFSHDLQNKRFDETKLGEYGILTVAPTDDSSNYMGNIKFYDKFTEISDMIPQKFDQEDQFILNLCLKKYLTTH